MYYERVVKYIMSLKSLNILINLLIKFIERVTKKGDN